VRVVIACMLNEVGNEGEGGGEGCAGDVECRFVHVRACMSPYMKGW